MSFSLTIARR